MPTPIISGPYRTFRRLNQYETYLEYEGSTITIPMKGRVNNGPWLNDEIKLKAFMRLEIYPPYINNLDTREFQFTIRDWDLYGTSPMLNELFFNDPRGRLTAASYKGKRVADYVPATVTFRVSNNYIIAVDSDSVTPCDLFASQSTLELRNLTSHTFRNWIKVSEHDGKWIYTHPEHRIYWEALSDVATKKLAERAKTRKTSLDGLLVPGAAAVLFHKKDPALGVFDVTLDGDRADYLLGIADLSAKSDGGPVTFRAVNPVRGFEENFSQLNGNTVLSTWSRPQEPLEIRWALSSVFKDSSQFNEFILNRAKDQGFPSLQGFIRIVSPARSLGTADQGPALGEPIDSADFPARLTYAVNYDIFVNCDRFVEDHAGIAIAVGAIEIPPRDVTVAFDKPHLGHVLGRFLEFGPGHCTGMHEIPPRDYAAGLNFARYWRGVPLEENDPGWSRFEPYDPSREY